MNGLFIKSIYQTLITSSMAAIFYIKMIFATNIFDWLLEMHYRTCPEANDIGIIGLKRWCGCNKYLQLPQVQYSII